MLIASQFLLWVAAALLLIAVLALSRQVSGLRERLEQNAVCPRCGDAAGSHAAEPH
jgi:formate dehydrogenase maturation protein FdhE